MVAIEVSRQGVTLAMVDLDYAIRMHIISLSIYHLNANLLHLKCGAPF